MSLRARGLKTHPKERPRQHRVRLRRPPALAGDMKEREKAPAPQGAAAPPPGSVRRRSKRNFPATLHPKSQACITPLEDPYLSHYINPQIKGTLLGTPNRESQEYRRNILGIYIYIQRSKNSYILTMFLGFPVWGSH